MARVYFENSMIIEGSKGKVKKAIKVWLRFEPMKYKFTPFTDKEV